MDFASFTSTQGRLARKPFALGVLGIYLAGIAAQALLSGAVTARAGLWPFIIVQAALIWVWLVLHVRRLRDAGQAPAAAIGVALVYTLALGVLLVLFLFAIVFKPDFGVFTTILKGLILIAFLPALISLLFSIRAGMRKS